MYCKKCGKQIQDGSAFCDGCGAPQQIPAPASQTAYQPPQYPADPSSGKALKIALFCLLGVFVVAFGVFAYFQWFQSTDTSGLAIMDELPETNLQELSDWDADEFSLSHVGNAQTENAQPLNQTSAADAARRILGAWEGESDGSYIGFEFMPDGTMRYFEDSDEYIYQYAVTGNEFTLFENDLEIGVVAMTFDGDDQVTLTADGTLVLSRVEALSPPAAAATPETTPQPDAGKDPDVVFANGFEVDIEGYLADTWWASAGTSIANPDAVAAAPGYPKAYDIGAGSIQYIFDTEAMTVQLLTQDEDGIVTDEGVFDYEIDPYGFYLYSFNRTQNIEGKDYRIQSMFFVCDGMLYEVELVDGAKASNYIAYEIYGP